jgi:predicted transcriptional regulator
MAHSTSVKLDEGLRDRLRSIAVREGSTPNRLMNEAINEFVDRKERRTAYLAEVNARYEEYRETGLHLTEDEVDEWLDALLRGEDPPIPEPHT